MGNGYPLCPSLLIRFRTQFLISVWYKRDELSQRTAYLSSGSLIANATGSLIASGILGATDNVFGVAAWRWLFFIEGELRSFTDRFVFTKPTGSKEALQCLSPHSPSSASLISLKHRLDGSLLLREWSVLSCPFSSLTQSRTLFLRSQYGVWRRRIPQILQIPRN